MSDYVMIPRSEWESLKHAVDFIKKAILPLAQGYKPGKWMSAEETMAELGIKESRLKQLRASGMIRYQKPASGKRIEYLRTDIEEYKQGRIVLPSIKKPAVDAAGL